MKYLLLALFIATSCSSFAQKKNKPLSRADSVNAAADLAVKAFTWDIQKEDKGTLMFLDVPYQQEHSDSIEYLSLTVAKDKSKPRPDFISIILPNNVVQENGIFVKFSKTVKKNGQWDMQMEIGDPVRIPFEDCNDKDCTARIINGYAAHDNGEKEDIFQKFLDFDHVLFLFVYPDGSHKSLSVPLFSFKEQYRKLQ